MVVPESCYIYPCRYFCLASEYIQPWLFATEIPYTNVIHTHNVDSFKIQFQTFSGKQTTRVQPPPTETNPLSASVDKAEITARSRPNPAFELCFNES